MPGKRRELTADDLLRMQEDGPSRKRLRETLELEDSDLDSDDGMSPLPSQRRSDGADESEDENEDEDEDNDEDEDEDDDEDEVSGEARDDERSGTRYNVRAFI